MQTTPHWELWITPLRQLKHPWLEKDLYMVANFFNRWHLKMSMPKNVSTVFHLANRCANRELNINGTRLNFDPTLKYLGVTLDRSLTFHKHVIATVNKTQARQSVSIKETCLHWMGR